MSLSHNDKQPKSDGMVTRQYSRIDGREAKTSPDHDTEEWSVCLPRGKWDAQRTTPECRTEYTKPAS